MARLQLDKEFPCKSCGKRLKVPARTKRNAVCPDCGCIQPVPLPLGLGDEPATAADPLRAAAEAAGWTDATTGSARGAAAFLEAGDAVAQLLTPRNAPQAKAPPQHLIAERLSLTRRRHVLERLRQAFQAGARDAEMLYLGGRYAVALGLDQEACKFLQPLAESLLDENGQPAASYFPVGLLLLRACRDEKQRAPILAHLRSLAERTPKFAAVLERTGLADPDRHVVGSPYHVIAQVRQRADHAPTAGAESILPELVQLARTATEHYQQSRLKPARRALEDMLLSGKADESLVLRNLIIVAGEQQDVEAYERYWRRYVQTLLWQLFSQEGALAAWAELMHFYTKVATLTDRLFADAVSKVGETLRRPGLLARWLEAHAGLVWLDAWERRGGAAAGERPLMTYWLGAFYPAFSALPGNAAKTDAPAPPLASGLLFDPTRKFLTRFLEWHRLGFALQETDALESVHFQTVLALTGCAARMPAGACVRELSETINDGVAKPIPFRLAFRRICDLPMQSRVDPLFEAKDWAGAARFLTENFHDLSPDLKMLRAYAFAQASRGRAAIDAACSALPEFEPDDLSAESKGDVPWINTVYAACSDVLEKDSKVDRPEFGLFRARIEKVPDLAHLQPLKKRALLDIAYCEAIDRSRRLVAAEKYKDALKIIEALPDAPEIAERKKGLLEQIREQESRSQVLAFIRNGEFDKARTALASLPQNTDEQRASKKNLQKVIDEQQSFKTKHGGAMDKIRECFQKGNYALARTTANQLPADIKAEILQQIGQQEAIGKKVDAVMARVQAAVNRGDFMAARSAINDLPSEASELKKNLIKQLSDLKKKKNPFG